MMHFTRPGKPASFENDMEKIRKEVSDAIVIGKAFDYKGKSKWSNYKSQFAAAQHDKCAFCEVEVLRTGRGDVEHYRPKGAVHELPINRADLGTKTAHEATPDGRRNGPCVSTDGYWWLAYQWDNWLFACTVCNQDWKRNFLPTDSPRIPITEHCEQHEMPLLLHPYEGPNPVEHLEYTSDGMIYARNQSRWGQATIDTCGLDLRPELLQARAKIARKVYALLGRLEDALTVKQRDEYMDQLMEYCDPKAEHAGMVLSILDQYSTNDTDAPLA